MGLWLLEALWPHLRRLRDPAAHSQGLRRVVRAGHRQQQRRRRSRAGGGVKIAFAGAGYIINIHASAARAQKDVELVAVVEKYPDRAAALARKFGIPHQYETIEQLLNAG